jgi:hypothetical protein
VAGVRARCRAVLAAGLSLSRVWAELVDAAVCGMTARNVAGDGSRGGESQAMPHARLAEIVTRAIRRHALELSAPAGARDEDSGLRTQDSGGSEHGAP